MTELRRKGVRWFATAEEAAQRFVLVNGLRGVLEPGTHRRGGRVGGRDRRSLAPGPRPPFHTWRPRPRSPACWPRPRPGGVGRRRGRHHGPRLRAAEFGVTATTLTGLGHNAHVEAPAVVLELARRPLAGGWKGDRRRNRR